MKPIAPLLLVSFVLAYATQSLAEPPSASVPQQENPYTKSYVAQSRVARKSEPGAPQIFLGKDKVADYQRQLEKGYDILGYSSFEAGDVAPEKLAEQAAAVNADMVLVYTNETARMPASVKLDIAKSDVAAAQAAQPRSEASAEDKAPAKSNVLYSYFASYWTRLPPSIVGVHIRGISETAAGGAGVVVLAVIEGSPAATVLNKDDVLLQLGEVRLDKPEMLMQAARRYAGQTVEVVFERSGEIQRKQLALGIPR